MVRFQVPPGGDRSEEVIKGVKGENEWRLRAFHSLLAGGQYMAFFIGSLPASENHYRKPLQNTTGR